MYSFMLDRALFGLEPLGFRLHNLLLHFTAAAFLFLMIRAARRKGLAGSGGRAAVGGQSAEGRIGDLDYRAEGCALRRVCLRVPLVFSAQRFSKARSVDRRNSGRSGDLCETGRDFAAGGHDRRFDLSPGKAFVRPGILAHSAAAGAAFSGRGGLVESGDGEDESRCDGDESADSAAQYVLVSVTALIPYETNPIYPWRSCGWS